MELSQELPLTELIFTAITLLIGEEDKDFIYYEEDEDWWRLRLYTRRN